MRHESRSGILWREGQEEEDNTSNIEGYEQSTAIHTRMKMKFSDFCMSHSYPK